MSGPPTTVLGIPEPLDEDDDDIRWALQTAAVQWKRGARDDAIAWLRRGADAAVDGGAWERASQLNVLASQLERAIAGESEPPAPPSAPKFPPRASTPVSHSVVPQSVRSGPPSAAASVKAPAFSSAVPPHSKWPTGFPPSAVAFDDPVGARDRAAAAVAPRRKSSEGRPDSATPKVGLDARTAYDNA